MNWTRRVSDAEASRRAGGRRRYNAERHLQAEERRMEVLHLIGQGGWYRGMMTDIARQLGVHPSTVSRDIYAVMSKQPCPTCHQRRW